MKTNALVLRSVTLAVTLSTLLLAVAPIQAGPGAPRTSPPNSKSYGRSLAEWLGTYWRWYYTGADPAQSKVDGVQLMPLPAGEFAGGSGTPEDPAVLTGHVSITLHPGTPFVLPEFAWVLEHYDPSLGVPDDQPVADDVFLASVHPVLSIDGRVVLSDDNKSLFYVAPTSFDPIIPYATPSAYGSIAAIAFQGEGLVSPPLAVGTHQLHLQESFIVPAGVSPVFPSGFGIVYNNTWTIVVAPK